MLKIYMSEETYHYLRDEDSGICKACHAVMIGGCEPDAENYECDECGEMSVEGIENLLIDETISFEIEPSEDAYVIYKTKSGGSLKKELCV